MAVADPCPTLYGVTSAMLPDYWSQAAPLIQQALLRTGSIDDYHLSDIYNFIMQKQMQLWVVMEAGEMIVAAVTEIVVTPRRKILAIPFTGGKYGEIESWLPYLHTLKAFGASHGCSAIRGWGRLGWKRKLQADKYGLEFELEIVHENLH